MEKKKIVVLIPSLNPKEDLIDYVKTFDLSIDIIIIDDGSKKELKYIFIELSKLKNVTVLTHAVNLGKGRALKTGFNHYINNYDKKNSGGVTTADSDGQHLVKDVINIGKRLNKEAEKSIILGTRDFNEKQVPFKSRNGNKITTLVFKLLYGKKINDTQTGLRGISYDFVKKCITIEGERFEYEINMLIEAVKDKVEIKEEKIETIYFDNNSETHFNPVKDSIKIYSVMFKKFLKFFVSGITSSILDLGLFALVYSLIKEKIKTSKAILVATITARIFSSIYNYSINKNIVFNNNKQKITIIKYYILCIFQALISWILVNNVYVYIGKIFSPTIIKIIVDIILFLISYQIQQRWVFSKK